MSDNSLNRLDDSEKEDNIKVYENDEAYILNDISDEEASNKEHTNEEDDLYHNEINENMHPNNIKKNTEVYDEDKYYQQPDNENEIEIRNEEDKKDEDTVRNQELLNEQDNDEEQYEEEDANQDLNQEPDTTKNEQNEEEEFRLISLNYISICQLCKTSFNSSENVPFLFKCGHFFCKKCIEENFIDEEGIKCPQDGYVANSMDELKLLSNLIVDKSIDNESSRRRVYCEIHKGQKLTHYIEDTKELICVYCAFNKFKKNPKVEIKEVKDKNNEMYMEINSIIEDNQHNVELIQSSLKEIKKNKEMEEKRISLFYDMLINNLQKKKNELLNQVNNLFTNNARKLSKKLEIFSTKIEDSEILKTLITDNNDNNDNNFNFIDTLDKFNALKADVNENSKLKISLKRYRFNHEDENKTNKYLSNLGELIILNTPGS